VLERSLSEMPTIWELALLSFVDEEVVDLSLIEILETDSAEPLAAIQLPIQKRV
jgi:hypothetical protein